MTKKKKAAILVDTKSSIKPLKKNIHNKELLSKKINQDDNIEKKILSPTNSKEDKNYQTTDIKNVNQNEEHNLLNNEIEEKKKTTFKDDINNENIDRTYSEKSSADKNYKQKIKPYILLVIVIINYCFNKIAEYAKKFSNTLKIIFFIFLISFIVKITFYSIIEYYYNHQVELQTHIFNKQTQVEKMRQSHAEKLQNELFKQQIYSQKIETKNKLTIEYLSEGQRRSVELFENIRIFRSRIDLLERSGSGGIALKTLENYRKETIQIKIIGKNISSEIVVIAAEIVESEISKYIECLKLKRKKCSKEFSLEPFITLNNAFSKTIQQFIN